MEDKLSHRPDELLAPRDESSALGTNVTSSSSSLLTPMKANALKADSEATMGPELSSNSNRAPSETDSETNNNLKIFKNEYSNSHPAAANMKHPNGITEQQQQSQTPSHHKPSSNGTGSTSGLSASEDQHQQESESSVTCNNDTSCGGDVSNATSEVTPATETHIEPTTTSAIQRELQEQPQVPSKPPPIANNRSILILREIEPHNPESSVRDIFDSENCPSKPIHCEYALQNSWYVTFKDDEDARLALAYLRNHIIRWNGRQIMARYKPKPAVASAVNQPPPHHNHQHHHLHHHHQKHHIVPPMVMQQQQQEISSVENGGDLESAGNIAAVARSMIASGDPALVSAPLVGDGSGLVTPTGVPGQPPVVLSPANTMLNTSGGSTPGISPNNGQFNHHHLSGGLMSSYGHQHSNPYQAAPLPPHHHHPDGSLVHHPHHLGQAAPHMMGSAAATVPAIQQPHHQDHHQQHLTLPAGYNPYYSQQSQMVHAPWDLSTVFVYNGLSPYNKTSVSSVQLVSGAYHQHQQQQHQQQQHHHQNHNGHHGPQRHQNHHHHNHNSHHHRNQKPPTPTSTTQQSTSQSHQGYHNHIHQQSTSNNSSNSNIGANGQQQQTMFTSAAYHQGSKSSRKNKQHNK